MNRILSDRAALLREVTRAGFVPSPPQSGLAEENRLRGEVDDFAATFFATPLLTRRERWHALTDQCAFSPPLTARLVALGPGLDVDVALGAIGNPRTAQLASHVAGLFVLAPAARAAQRQTVLRSMVSDIDGWEEIVKQLQAIAPALAALEPTLLRSILGWRERQQQLARVREGRKPAAPRPAARPPARPRAPAATGAGTGKGVGCGVLVLIVTIIRFFSGTGSHSSYNTPPPRFDPPPRFAPVEPPRDRKAADDFQRLFRETEEQRRRREAQERLRRIQDEINKQPPKQPGLNPEKP